MPVFRCWEESSVTAKRILFVACASAGILLVGRAAMPRSPSANPMAQTAPPPGAPSSPPVAPVRPVTEVYFGTKVVDRYRYMENLRDS